MVSIVLLTIMPSLSRPPRSGWSMLIVSITLLSSGYLPKLAEWIGENLQDDLWFPDKADPRRGWTPTELNNILDRHIVRDRNGCALRTFGCIEWESEVYRGVMRARCYPFKMPKHTFRGTVNQRCQ